MPPAIAAEPTRKARRENPSILPMSLLRHLCRGRVDRGADARIGPATTEIAGHHFVDVFIRRLGDQLEKRDGLHDLAGLAIAALRDLMFDPGLQNRMLVFVAQPVERDDLLAGEVADLRLTGT